jgi:hypothetical protein
MDHLDDDDAWADADAAAERYARFVREGGGGDAVVGGTRDRVDPSLPELDGTASADVGGSTSSDERLVSQSALHIGTGGVGLIDGEHETIALVATPASSSTSLQLPQHAPSFVSPLPPMTTTAHVGAGPAPLNARGALEDRRQKVEDVQASNEQQEEKKEGAGPRDYPQRSGYDQRGVGIVNETIIEEDTDDDNDEDGGDLTTPLVLSCGHSSVVGDGVDADTHDEETHRESSLRDVDLSPPPSPLHQGIDDDAAARSHLGSVGPSEKLQSSNQISYRKAGGDDPPAPIRFGTFINKHILRARRLFKRGSRTKDADGGGNIAGAVKFDPATGSLLPASGDAGASTMHASDLRRRKSRIRQYCERTQYGRSILRSTLTVMHFLGRLLLWTSIIAMVVMIIYYSHELRQNGTDPHLIAWFSAGAFVLLGFPISIYGIFTHLSNYYQPHIQCYVVRILWMVPIYSIESWLCLRFHTYAIYIETLRDCYESFVLYSFFQFLIQVLGGEEQLVLMLKDKSPTRGVHIWGFDWCIRPWLMGQPVSRTYVVAQSDLGEDAAAQSTAKGGGGSKAPRTIKQVRWTSPFLVKCKRGILQYVVLKFVCSVSAMLLEVLGWYHEGSFSPKYGYFYICLLTNFSQCWALYCLVFFYYATKNELGPIRPVGKFLSVKALVFFTWWQSVGISILFQMGMIPHYSFVDGDPDVDGEDSNLDWTAEDVAKGLQDYLICIEMFGAAILHTFVFPHTDYLIGIAGNPTQRAYSAHIPGGVPRTGKRLGRKGKVLWNGTAYTVHRDDRSVCSKSSSIAPDQFDLELGPVPPSSAFAPATAVMDEGGKNSPTRSSLSSDEEGASLPRQASTGNISQISAAEQDGAGEEKGSNQGPLSSAPVSGSSGMASYSQHSAPQQHPTQPKGFVHAFLDSTLPKDVLDESVGYLRGNMAVEKKTLLSHAATSDEYDLFSKSSSRRKSSTAASVGRARRAASNKTIFPKNIGYPGVPMLKSVKEQD